MWWQWCLLSSSGKVAVIKSLIAGIAYKKILKSIILPLDLASSICMLTPSFSLSLVILVIKKMSSTNASPRNIAVA